MASLLDQDVQEVVSDIRSSAQQRRQAIATGEDPLAIPTSTPLEAPSRLRVALPSTSSISGRAAVEPQSDNSFVGNAARGIGERTLDLIGGLSVTADTVLQRFDPTVTVEVPDRLLQRAAGWLQDVDLGYEPQFTFDDIEQSFNDGNVGGMVGNALGFIAETGLVSAPDIAAILTVPWTYLAAFTGDLAAERAENDGRDFVTGEDLAIGSLGAAISVASDRLGLRIAGLPAGRSAALKWADNLAGDFVNYMGNSAGKRIGSAALFEALQEGAQEAIETVTTQAGTERGLTSGDVLRSAIAGSIAGGGIGGTLRTAAEIVGSGRQQSPPGAPGTAAEAPPAAGESEAERDARRAAAGPIGAAEGIAVPEGVAVPEVPLTEIPRVQRRTALALPQEPLEAPEGVQPAEVPLTPTERPAPAPRLPEESLQAPEDLEPPSLALPRTRKAERPTTPELPKEPLKAPEDLELPKQKEKPSAKGGTRTVEEGPGYEIRRVEVEGRRTEPTQETQRVRRAPKPKVPGEGLEVQEASLTPTEVEPPAKLKLPRPRVPLTGEQLRRGKRDVELLLEDPAAFEKRYGDNAPLRLAQLAGTPAGQGGLSYQGMRQLAKKLEIEKPARSKAGLTEQITASLTGKVGIPVTQAEAEAQQAKLAEQLEKTDSTAFGDVRTAPVPTVQETISRQRVEQAARVQRQLQKPGEAGQSRFSELYDDVRGLVSDLQTVRMGELAAFEALPGTREQIEVGQLTEGRGRGRLPTGVEERIDRAGRKAKAMELQLASQVRVIRQQARQIDQAVANLETGKSNDDPRAAAMGLVQALRQSRVELGTDPVGRMLTALEQGNDATRKMIADLRSALTDRVRQAQRVIDDQYADTVEDEALRVERSIDRQRIAFAAEHGKGVEQQKAKLAQLLEMVTGERAREAPPPPTGYAPPAEGAVETPTGLAATGLPPPAERTTGFLRRLDMKDLRWLNKQYGTKQRSREGIIKAVGARFAAEREAFAEEAQISRSASGLVRPDTPWPTIRKLAKRYGVKARRKSEMVAEINQRAMGAVTSRPSKAPVKTADKPPTQPATSTPEDIELAGTNRALPQGFTLERAGETLILKEGGRVVRRYADTKQSHRAAKAHADQVVRGRLDKPIPSVPGGWKSVDGGARADEATQRLAREIAALESEPGVELNLNDVLRLIEKIGMRGQKTLARQLRSLDMNTPLRLVDAANMPTLPTGESPAGAYYREANRIDIRRDTLTEKTILHEAVHAATVNALDNNVNFREDMQHLWRYTRDTLHSGTPIVPEVSYGLRNVREFVAEAMTNPSFQQALKELPAPAVRPSANIWTAFVDLIARGLRRLGVVPRRSVLEDTLQAYENLHGTRGQLDALTPGNVKPYLNTQMPQNEAEATSNISILADVNKGSTDQDVEVPESWLKSKRIDWKTGARNNVFLQFMNMRQITWGYGDKVPNLQEYQDITLRKGADAREYQERAEKILMPWQQLYRNDAKDGQRLDNLLWHSTHYNVDPTRNQQEFTNKRAWQEAVKQYNALSDDAKIIYNKLLAWMERDRKFTIDQIGLNIASTLDPEGKLGLDKVEFSTLNKKKIQDLRQKHPDWPDAYFNRMTQYLRSRLSRREVYMPMKRYGNHVVVAKTPEQNVGVMTNDELELFELDHPEFNRTSKDEISPEDMKRLGISAAEQEANPRYQINGRYYHVEFLESRREAARLAATLKQEVKPNETGTTQYDTVEIKLRREGQTALPSTPTSIINALESNIDDPSSRMAAREAILSLLPETSIAKANMRRKGVEGATKDFRRVFATYIRSAGYYQAQLRYGREQADAFATMDEETNKLPDQKQYVAQSVVNHLGERQQHELAFLEEGALIRHLPQIGYLWFLFSPSYSMVNLTQPALLGYPFLSARHGAVRAARMMARMQRVIAPPLVKSAVRTGGGFRRLFTTEAMTDTLNAYDRLRDRVLSTEGIPYRRELAGMMDFVESQGLFNLSFGQDIRNLSEFGTERSVPGRIMSAATDMAIVMPHLVELHNRTLMALSSYVLARQKGKNVEQARDEAVQAVARTQFDYTASNKPLMLTRGGPLGSLARPIMMFKQYPLGVYGDLILNARQALKGATKEERSIGRRALLMTLSMHAIAAGAIAGVPEPIRIAMQMVGSLFYDEDEYFDLDLEVTKLAQEMLGEEVGGVVAKGAPWAFGVDVSNRIGLDNMLFFDIGGSDDPEATFGRAAAQFIGPVGGMALNFVKGYDQLKQGNYAKWMQLWTPKGARDILRAAQFGDVGMTNTRGEVIYGSENFSASELFTQMMGFTPSTASKVYERRAEYYGRRGQLAKTKSKLLTAMRQATTPEEIRGAYQEIIEFNRRNPHQPITSKGINRSLADRRKRDILYEMYGGIAPGDKDQWLLEGAVHPSLAR